MQRGTVTALLAVVAVVVVAVVAVVVVSGDDGGDAGASGGPIRLEPVGAELPNPFVEDDLDLAASLGRSVGVGFTELPDGVTDEVTTPLSGRSVAGDEAGLYGGSLDTAVCDVDQLVAFLTDPANAEKAEAWAGAQGIDAGDVAGYVEGLTPVRLRLDTRVTNHAFEGGEAQPFQSVLQAGTAVLVDERGVPRAKCSCGNPLAEPAPVEGGADEGEALDLEALVENLQDAWENLVAEEIVTVKPGEEQDSIVVADLDTGERFERPVGTKGDEDRPSTGGTGPGDDDGTGEPGAGEPAPGGPATSTGPGSGGGGGGGDGCQRRTETRPDGAIVEYCD